MVVSCSLGSGSATHTLPKLKGAGGGGTLVHHHLVKLLGGTRVVCVDPEGTLARVPSNLVLVLASWCIFA